MALSLLVALAAAAASPSFDDLLEELAAAVATAVPANETVRVTGAGGEHAMHARALAATLARRGVRTVGTSDAGTEVICTCSATVRERLCMADLRKGDASQIVSVQRLREDTVALPPGVPMVLDLRPLITQTTPILDVVTTESRLLVLDSSGVTRYDRADQRWRPRETKAIAPFRPWPRDVRGRLIATGTSFEAYLPGVVCRGTIDPLGVSCVEQQAAWPLGADNQGIVPARNYFSAANGLAYYSIAALDADAGARWIAATRDSQLVLLDAAGASVAGAAAAGDDVVRLTTPCASGTFVLSSPPEPEDATDTLRLFRVADRHVAAATPPLVLGGRLTALWPTADASTATAVAHNAMTGGYDAFQVRVACGR